MSEENLPLQFKVSCAFVGLNFRTIEAKQRAAQLELNERVDLEREPTNPYDTNAIRVIARERLFDFNGELSKDSEIREDEVVDSFPRMWIGYLPKNHAAELAHYIDKGCYTIEAFVLALPNVLDITLTKFERAVTKADEPIVSRVPGDEPGGDFVIGLTAGIPMTSPAGMAGTAFYHANTPNDAFAERARYQSSRDDDRSSSSSDSGGSSSSNE